MALQILRAKLQKIFEVCKFLWPESVKSVNFEVKKQKNSLIYEAIDEKKHEYARISATNRILSGIIDAAYKSPSDVGEKKKTRRLIVGTIEESIFEVKSEAQHKENRNKIPGYWTENYAKRNSWK